MSRDKLEDLLENLEKAYDALDNTPTYSIEDTVDDQEKGMEVEELVEQAFSNIGKAIDLVGNIIDNG